MTLTENHKLIIMRHAKSDWSTDASTDFDRPLSSRGDRDAPRMAGWLADQGLVPGLILCSPALRTKQTVLAVVEKLRIPEQEIVWEQKIYEASLSQLLDVLDRYSAAANSVLLVGHNPGLDSLLEYLSDTPPVYRRGKLMTTAAIAVLGFGDQGISTREHSARLEMLVRPKDLEE